MQKTAAANPRFKKIYDNYGRFSAATAICGGQVAEMSFDLFPGWRNARQKRKRLGCDLAGVIAQLEPGNSIPRSVVTGSPGQSPDQVRGRGDDKRRDRSILIEKML